MGGYRALSTDDRGTYGDSESDGGGGWGFGNIEISPQIYGDFLDKELL